MTSPRRTADLPSIFDGFNAKDDKRRKIIACARELRRLAVQRKALGVTATDTRRIAIAKGYATGAELDLRALSWFGPVPTVARLFRTPRTRRERMRNASRVYVARAEWV